MVPSVYTSDWCNNPIFRSDILFCKTAESEIEKGIFNNFDDILRAVRIYN